jgi:putative membrane-bound dehydrogenase-like protein
MMKPTMPIRALASILIVFGLTGGGRVAAEETESLRVLFLGDRGHHDPSSRARVLIPVLKAQKIEIEYTDQLADLNPENLETFDVLLLYANHDAIEPQQERALLDFVRHGKGLVAVHCASYCFRNSEPFVALVGGQFKEHGAETFRARIVDAQHPAMQGVQSFDSFDETYLHTRLADDNRVLMVRDHQGGVEPYTWVRTLERGRMFYTALGHDLQTWSQPQFQKLLANGLRWAAGETSEEPLARVADDSIPAPLSPEESMARMHLPEGFNVKLVAAEPQISTPLAMAFDERSRLWVLDSVDYPNKVLPEGKGHDRIKILQDQDGDGRVETVKVFAEGLNIPTGIVLAEGGAIVVNTPDILLLRDTDGDDVADERRVLFTGLGRFDTHAVASNLFYGHDNWIWGTVGYSGLSVKVGEKTHTMKMGLFRFRPDGSDFEVMTATDNNTWGLGFTSAGDVVASTANRHHSWFLAVPNRAFESVRGWHAAGSHYNADHHRSHPLELPPRQWDHAGSFTSACNATVYAAAQFPAPYPERTMFVCEPTIHLIHNNLLVREGSNLVARDGWNLMASDDPWCGPTQALVGPDGAVWFIDLYSYVMLHNKPDEPREKHGTGNAWLTGLRDLEHARIYRIVYGRGESAARTSLHEASPEQLLSAMGDDNLHWRLMAQRLLVERAQLDVIPQLIALVAGDSPRAAQHALYTLAGLDALTKAPQQSMPALVSGLQHADPGVQRAALAALPRSEQGAELILRNGLLEGNDPFVRREALLALAECPAVEQGGPAVATVLAQPENSGDRWIPLAATSAAARNAVSFLLAALDANVEQQKVAAMGNAARVVAEHLARTQSPAQASALLVALSTYDASAVTSAILQGLVAGWPQELPLALPPQQVDRLAAWLEKLPASSQLDLLTLAQRSQFGERMEQAAGELKESLAKAISADTGDQERIDAAHSLILLAPQGESIALVLDQITPKASPQLTEGLLQSLGEGESAEIATAILERWETLTPAGRHAAIGLLLRRTPWTQAFLASLDQHPDWLRDMTVDQRQQLLRHPDAQLAATAKQILERGGQIPNPDRQKVIDSLAGLVETTGDATAGRAVFEKQCAKCHRHGNLGAAIAPDLTGIAARKKAEILIDVLDPNRSVEGNYRLYTVTTDDGRVVQGLLAAETQTAVELIDAEAKRQVVLRENIDQLVAGKLSLMPEGFEKLPPTELSDLLTFLTQRGKFLPLSLREVANSITTRGMFQDEALDWERLIFADWSPKEFAGVPFQLLDPQGTRSPNALVLHSPLGRVSRDCPKAASIACHGRVKALHLLGGVSGWGWPAVRNASVSMIVRLKYADGQQEDHPLVNGEHLADYNGTPDVPKSQLAFPLGGRQVRYLAIHPQRDAEIDTIEFVKGPDETAPVIMAVTAEGFE